MSLKNNVDELITTALHDNRLEMVQQINDSLSTLLERHIGIGRD